MFLRLFQSVLGRVRELLQGRKKNEEESSLERKVRLALRERATQCTRKPTLNTIAMKFHKADEAFKQLKKQFHKFDKDHSQSIDLEELQECLRELRVAMSEGEVRELFQEADMDASEGVQFKEFILLLALVHLLQPGQARQPEPPSETQDAAPELATDGALQSPGPHMEWGGSGRFGLPEVDAAFDMIEDAFLFFDQNRDGYLTKGEIADALRSGKEGIAAQAVEKRFAEMDYNTDGHCSYKEFLFAYVGWVGTAEEEEDQDEFDDPDMERR